MGLNWVNSIKGTTTGLNWANSMQGTTMGSNLIKLETNLKPPWDKSDGA